LHRCEVRRAALVLAAIVGVLFLLNREVLRDTVLVNSPSFDALVYQNQSYDDLSLIRSSGPLAVLSKYADGRRSSPPLYSLIGTLSYMLFGRDPANFYILPGVSLWILALGTFGYVHHWASSRLWSWVAAAAVLTIPSVVTFGLRISQIDFAVGASFTFATYVLVASDGLRGRRWSAVYAAFVAACLLLKSSIALYFLAHAVIWLAYIWADAAQRWRRLLHTAAVIAAVAVCAGWFYVRNLPQIIAYYVRFGTTLSNVSHPRDANWSWINEVTFYWQSFTTFHLRADRSMLYAITGAVSLLALALLVLRDRPRAASREMTGLALAGVWLLVPYAILSAYASKANSVDFPFVAAFFVIPVLAAAIAFRHRLLPLGVLVFVPLLATQFRDQLANVVIAERTPSWHEEQVLRDLFADADQLGLKDVGVSNAFIHQHLTSENLRYFVVNGTFPEWESHYHILPLGYFFNPDDYYTFLLSADYVLAKTGSYVPSDHPDNVVAPAVNDLLKRSSQMEIIKQYALPDGTELLLFRNASRARLTYPAPLADGWIQPRFPFTFRGPPADRHVQISGRLPLPEGLLYPAHLVLQDARGVAVTSPVEIPDDEARTVMLTVPAGAFPSGAPTILYLTSDRAYRPADYGVNNDTRELLMLVSSIEELP